MKSQISGMCAEINERITFEEEEMAKVQSAQEIEETIWQDRDAEFNTRIRDIRQRLTRLQTTVSTLQEFYDK
jgi:predicted  nucleic acid-binding Zn-ribbon protein